MKMRHQTQNLSSLYLDKFFYEVRTRVLGILFAAFLFVAFHSAIHQSFEHKHDIDCPVYVLEQFYFAADIITLDTLFTIFLPFASFSFELLKYTFYVPHRFRIRTPPFYTT